MRVDQLQSKIEATFVDDIACSTNPIFMAIEIIKKLTKKMLKFLMAPNKIDEIGVLKDELICRVNCMNVSSNYS